MFQGSLPTKAIKIIGNIVKEWDCKRIYIGCSGNFTIERSISSIINCPITSNDVTIYSSYIGKYFVGEPLKGLKIKDNYQGECIFFKDYMESDADKVATLILAADILPFDGSNLAYSKRMLKGYKEQFSNLHKKLVIKLKDIKVKIDTFYNGDVMNLINEIPDNCGFISFPPFFKGGYEKMWAKLEEVFEYDKPEYIEFNPDLHIKQFCETVKKLDNFVIGTEREVEELKKFYAGIVQTLNGKNIYMYSKTKKKHYVRAR